MNHSILSKQILTLATIYQCSQIVHQVATKGMCSYEDFKKALLSLFISSPDDIDSFFSDTKKLKSGIIACRTNLQLNDPNAASIHINRYTILLLSLEKKLSQRPELLKQITSEVSRQEPYTDNLDNNMDTLIHSLAQSYIKTIKSNSQSIIIKGSKEHLNKEFNSSKIRTMLLTGFRLAILWRQLGGRRWHLLIKRQAIIKQCEIIEKTL